MGLGCQKLWPVKETRPIHVARAESAAGESLRGSTTRCCATSVSPAADAIYLSSKPFWKDDLNADDIDAYPGAPGGALVRTVRAVGRWFSRSVNALGQPYENADADRWFDWPRFPPF